MYYRCESAKIPETVLVVVERGALSTVSCRDIVIQGPASHMQQVRLSSLSSVFESDTQKP